MSRTYARKRPALDPCPVEEVFALVAGKWKVRILYLLFQRPHRFSELQRALENVSQQVMSDQLMALQDSQLIVKTTNEEFESTRYALTNDGDDLVRLLFPVAAWGEERLRLRGLSWDPPKVVAIE